MDLFKIIVGGLILSALIDINIKLKMIIALLEKM
jgi:hypothetical protein